MTRLTFALRIGWHRIGVLALGAAVLCDLVEPCIAATGPHPGAGTMLAGAWVPDDPRTIDFDGLPRLSSVHSIVSDVRAAGGTRVNQHNYLVHFGGRFWAMWSDGPGDPGKYYGGRVPGHDLAAQRVSYATSLDGIHWSQAKDLAGPPDEDHGWIARGFWVREGRLLALASRYKAPGYAGEGLSLHAFTPQSDDDTWEHLGMVFDDALNNFPPKRLPTGEWMMSRRDHARDVHFLLGGVTRFNEWKSWPVVGYRDSALAAEEPYWWVLPDGSLVAMFRDNRASGFLFRSFSRDHGRTWTMPVRTNFPDAASKFAGLRLSDGRYVLVSNPHPGRTDPVTGRRDPLALAVSDDGLVFHSMGYLVGGRHVDYPHVIEHDGFLLVAFATEKQTVEVLKIELGELDSLKNR